MCIFKFKSNLANRIATAKTLGFLIGLIAFFVLPMLVTDVSLMLRLAILLWYTTIGGIFGLFGIMDRHPAFPSWKFPFWFRGIFLGAWMNFVLALFAYDQLVLMMQSAGFAQFSPFWIVLEGAIIGLIIEFFATKAGGDGKVLCKEVK